LLVCVYVGGGGGGGGGGWGWGGTEGHSRFRVYKEGQVALPPAG
jgi:hypothetical protein